EEADDDALDFEFVGVYVAGLHFFVGGLEADFAAFLVIAFEGGFAGFGEQGDDLLAIAGGFAAFDDDVVAVAEVIVDHGFAAYAQAIDAGARVEERFHVDLFALLDGFDGGAGSDIAQQ